MTPSDPLPPLPPGLRSAAEALLAGGGRRILGLVGAPGAGKSTLAQALAEALAPHAQVVPMDGFHLAQTELARLGRAHRKGAPDTFDAGGYAALLARLRTQRPGDATVYAPAFRRDLEEPIAGAIAVEAAVPLVIAEGNYLLLDDGPWAGVAAQLDAAWYVEAAPGLRLERLLQRHMRFGRSEAQARDWIAATDEPNARRIEATRGRAQRIVRWDG